MSLLTVPDLSHRAFWVLRRNLLVAVKGWRSDSWPPLVESLISLFAFGFGLGAYISGIADQSYIKFLAPGLVIQALLFASVFETTFGSYFRMENQRTFDAIIATPASIEDVALGEVLYGAARGMFSTVSFFIVVAVFGFWETPGAIWILPLALLASILFSSMGLLYTAITPSINAYNFFFTLYLTPNLFFGGVFFPLENLPEPIRIFAWFLPASHLAPLMRAVNTGQYTSAFWTDLAWVLIAVMIFVYLSIIFLRRRLIK